MSHPRPNLALVVALFFAATGTYANADDPAPKEIDQLVEQLNSAKFVEREAAMHELVKTGGSAIDQLVKSMQGGNQETVARGIYVLAELALSDDSNTSRRSWKAIEMFAETGEGSVKRRATDSLASLHAIRKDRARDILVQHGARVSDRRDQIGNVVIAVVYSIDIGQDFTGDEEVIDQIRWLDDARQISFDGEKVTDRWLEPLTELNELISVEVKRSKVTDKGIKKLKALHNLQYLSVYYSPVTDDSVKTISEIKPLAEVRLFGTQITDVGAAELAQALPAANIDYRRGAFLGVGCQFHDDGAQISIMHDGSAAEKAGMRTGDVIQEFDGTKVADFDELKDAIAKHRSGANVTVKALRAGTPMTFVVELGQWE